VYSDANRLLAEFFVENRTPVNLHDVPEALIAALIATEDARFYSHRGLDYRGILRALYRNIRARKIVEGGSTLTQQLAKVLFLTPERSYARKLKEMVLALKIEQRYTKREILSLYLNQIYYGSGAYGIEAAAQTYFGKPARELQIAESALLAGIPRSPKYYSPFRSREDALSRRRHVLKRMVSAGLITQSEANESDRSPLPEIQPTIQKGPAPAPYFVEYIRQKVEERFGSSILYTGGLNIYTSINDTLQTYAEKAVQDGLAAMERGRKTGKQGPRIQRSGHARRHPLDRQGRRQEVLDPGELHAHLSGQGLRQKSACTILERRHRKALIGHRHPGRDPLRQETRYHQPPAARAPPRPRQF
jgi:penicillin-binding protein 1A